MVEAAAAWDGDAGFAPDGHGLRGGVHGLADAFGELGDHKRLAAGQLAQEIPTDGIADGAENVGERDGGWNTKAAANDELRGDRSGCRAGMAGGAPALQMPECGDRAPQLQRWDCPGKSGHGRTAPCLHPP